MYVVNRKSFEQLVANPTLAYLLIRAIEHPCSTDQYPTHEIQELREYLVTKQLAHRVGGIPETEPKPIDDNDDPV